MTEKLPIEFFTPDGYINNNTQELLHHLFGYHKEGLKNTKYVPANFKKGAITLFSKIKFDRSLFKQYNLADWFVLLVHEQVHRQDIICHPQGALGFYFSYLLGWIQARFSYRKNEYEVKAYEKEYKARQIWNSHSTLLLEMLNKQIDTKTLQSLKLP